MRTNLPKIKINLSKGNPNLILCSDFHLREDTPICRTDNYWEAQWKKVDFISTLQKKLGCPVFHGGDLFDHWKPSPMLLTEASKHLPNNFVSVCGQHDLPQHNLELAYKSGIYNLMINGKLSIPQNGHWDQSLGDGRTGFIIKNKQVTIQHIMNYKGRLPWPGCSDPSALKLLKKYPQYDIILTGDNHKTFTEDYQGRKLINPGSLMRMDADQINHKPCVFLWWAKDNSIEQVFLPIEQGVISRDHIERKQERDNRINSFVKKLNTKWETKLSFEDNMETFKKENHTRKSVMDIIYEVMEDEK